MFPHLHIRTNQYSLLDPFFGAAPGPLELDLGCGKGGFLLRLAERFPERQILGADVMLQRLRRVAKKVAQHELTNVQLLRASNLDLVAFQLPDNCVDRVHILCPDPWPKQSQRGRRLITSEFLVRTARVLRPGGILHLATDDQPYLRSMQKTVASLTSMFAPDPELETIRDIIDLKTDFEQQWLAQGKTVPHLAFRLQK